MTTPLFILPTLHRPVPAKPVRTKRRPPVSFNIFPDIDHDLAQAVRQAVGGDLWIAQSYRVGFAKAPPSLSGWAAVPATPGYSFGEIDFRADIYALGQDGYSIDPGRVPGRPHQVQDLGPIIFLLADQTRTPVLDKPVLDTLLDAEPIIRSRVLVLDWRGKQVPWRGDSLPIQDLVFEPLSERHATDNRQRAIDLFEWWWRLNAEMVFQYTARLVLPLLRQHIFSSPGEVQGFLDLTRREQSSLGELVERWSTPSGSGLYGCDLSAEDIGTWASLGVVTVVSPEGEMRRCTDPVLWRRTPTDTISITDRGRELAQLIHKDCWDPGILRRLQEWADAGIGASRAAMETYIRRYFGRQLTFAKARVNSLSA
ncbi:MAG: hypothetical protein HY985_00370 [Magnetospirillum sp.]|nr:hypothetical protein [Magnetospirillum sp.]